MTRLFVAVAMLAALGIPAWLLLVPPPPVVIPERLPAAPQATLPSQLEAANLERNLRWMLLRERQRPAAPPRVGVFADNGVWHLGARSIVELLEREGVPCRVLDGPSLTAKELARLEAVVLPGGWAPHQRVAAGDNGLSALKDFAANGGRVVGICAGAYLMAKTVRYDGTDYPYPVGLFDGVAEGPVPGLAEYPKPGAVTLSVTDAGAKRGWLKGATKPHYYSGGSAFVGGTNVTVLATYPNGSAAVIARPFGKGEVVLLGSHLERPAPPAHDDPAAQSATGGLLTKLVVGK